jgi:hypothetical protein
VLLDSYFLDVLRRITSEIIADLPTIYEMPAEAVGWVDRVRDIRYLGDFRNCHQIDVELAFTTCR